MKNIYHYLTGLIFLALSITSSQQVTAQTLMPLPTHNNIYSGTVRGYWFTAPTNFTIVGVRVCIDAGTTDQYIHIMKINDPTPVLFPTMSTNFTTLAYISAATNNVIQTVNINVTAGDIIGILGAVGTGTANSYSAGVTPFATTINGFPLTLNRLLYQGAITSGPAPNYSTEGSGTPISRVEMYYLTGPPCPVPAGLGASAITSSTATVSWGAVAGSAGYEYTVNTTAGNPATAGTATALLTANVSGLTPSTNYYLHVRNKCSASSISQWVHYPFTTLPPCKPPVGFNVTNLTPVSATINWSVWLSAISYDYVIDQSNVSPGSSTGSINTLNTFAPAPGLQENTWYYVHIRSRCAGNEMSDWSLDSFLTPIVCRAPDVKIDHINTDEAVAYWEPVPTAIEYEYAITKSATPPIQGTKYKFLSIHTSALEDGVDYYMHVRSNCISVGTASTSPWKTVTFKTFPTTINSTGSADFSLACYPNPVTSVLTVNYTGIPTGDAVIMITDLAGRVLKQMPVTSNKTEINMDGFAKGVYLLKYTDAERSSMVHINKL